MTEPSKDHFFALLKQFQNGMMTTHTKDGELHTRPMAIAEVDAHGDLWLVSDIHSEKVEELEKDARVSLCMQDGQKFLAMCGKGEVIRDVQKTRSLWSEAFRVWFPNGADDPSLVLVRIKTSRGEFWDNEGKNRVRFLYDAAKAYLTGTKPPPNRNLQDKVSLRS